MAEELFGGVGGGGGGVEVTIGGNSTSGGGGYALISTGTMLVAGGNNVTVSQNGNSLTIHGETNSGATTFLAGASNLGNTLGTTGVVNNRLAIVGGNNITLSQSTNAQSATLTISGAALGTPALGAYNLGNTLGTTGMASGISPRMVFVGGNNVTLSQSLNAGASSGTITISAANTNSFTGGVSSGGNTAGTTGTVSNGILFVGGNNVTLQQSSAAGGATITVSAQQATGFVNSISVVGNTSGDVTAGTGRLILAGGNNVTLSGATAAGAMTLTISGGTAGGGFTGGVSSGGNTVGTTGTVSNGILFVGGNNITLSQSSGAGGATITVSGANIGGAQTGISGVSASDTVYTSGTIKITGSNMVTVKSGTGQAVIIDATQSIQTQSRFNLTLAGNTAGALADISSGSMTLAGGNNITLSQLGNAVTISGPTAREAVSLAGNSTSAGIGYTLVSTGTLILAGGNNITLSQDGHSVTISGANAGGAQTGISGIAGSAASTVSAGTVQFANSNGISFGLNGSTMTASHNALTSQSAQTGISGIAGSGASTVTNGTVQFANSNGVSFGLNGSTMTASISVTGAGINVTAGGNTTGTLALVNSGTLTLAGGNNITLSQAGNAITISGPSGGGAGVSSDGNTAGTTGTVDYQLVFVGGSNITLSQSVNGSSGTVTIIGASGATGTGAGFSAGMSTGGNTSGTAGTVDRQLVLVGGSNITLSQSQNASSATVTIIGPTVFAFSAGVSSQGNTSGNTQTVNNGIVFAGGNNITLSQATGASGATITISGPNAGGAQTGISGIIASDATYTSGTVQFTGSNNITVLSGTGQNIIISGPSGGGAGMGTGANTSGTSGTVGRQLYFYGGANISLSQSVSSDSGSLSIIGAAGGGAGNVLSASGNTVGTLSSQSSGTMVLAGGANITLSQSSNTITIVGAAGAAGIAGIAGSGASTVSGGTVQFANSNNITFGLNGSTITASYSQSTNQIATVYATSNTIQGSSGTVNLSSMLLKGNDQLSVGVSNGSLIFEAGGGGGGGTNQIGMSNVGNTAGTTGVISTSQWRYVMAGGEGITLSQSLNGSSGTVTIVGHSENTVSQWMPPGVGVSSFVQLGQSSLVMFPAVLQARLNLSRADLFVSNSVSTSSNSSHQATLSLAVGIYTRNASTLSLATSGSVSYTWNVTGSTSSGSLVGMRGFSVPIAATMQPGDYYIGVLSQTATANANWVTLSNLGLVAFPNAYSGLFGATNASNQFVPGLGVFTAQTAALPASVAFSGLQATSASTARPVINFLNFTA